MKKASKSELPRLSRAAKTILGMVRPKLTEEQIAADLETTQQNVNAWLNDKWKPAEEKQARMEELYGVPKDDWKIYDDESPPQPAKVKSQKPKRKTKSKSRTRRAA
jgi:transcriptional regulator with XRE-family HTH domain